jgi:nitric oxide reductase NorQ protein
MSAQRRREAPDPGAGPMTPTIAPSPRGRGVPPRLRRRAARAAQGPDGLRQIALRRAMAARVGRPLVTVACNDETGAADLLGRWLVKGGDTVWQDGPVTRAVREGAMLYLDEVAEAREDVIVVLHPLSDHRRSSSRSPRRDALRPRPVHAGGELQPGLPARAEGAQALDATALRVSQFDYPARGHRGGDRATESGSDAAVAKQARRLRGKVGGWTTPASPRPSPRAS